MTTGRIVVIASAVMWAAVFMAALATVHARHDARKYFVELQQLQNERDNLDIEWGRLRLEQSAYATHGLIEKVAHEDLGMSVPTPDEIVIVRQP